MGLDVPRAAWRSVVHLGTSRPTGSVDLPGSESWCPDRERGDTAPGRVDPEISRGRREELPAAHGTAAALASLMTTSRRRAFAGLCVSIAALAVACGGKAGGDGAGSGGATGDDGTGGTAADAGPSTPCDDYLQALVDGQCLGPVPPGQLATLQTRFDSLCAAAQALPGANLTSATIGACVDAIKAGSCPMLYANQGPCAFFGTLGAGTPCSTGAQCASASCTPTAGISACVGCSSLPVGAFTTNTSCGTCDPAAGLGEACLNGACGPGLSCDESSLPGTCVTATPSSPPTGGLAQGQTCRTSDGIFVDVCAPPYECLPEKSGASICRGLGASGDSCDNDQECQTGLGCSAAVCAAMTWVGAGHPCDSANRCERGSCPAVSGGGQAVCPTILAEGQRCDPDVFTATCDSFASCVGGFCVLGYAACE
jgi:hypothetical protein